jgi:hypothetical protein
MHLIFKDKRFRLLCDWQVLFFFYNNDSSGDKMKLSIDRIDIAVLLIG